MVFWNGRSAIWGGATLGLIVGLAIGIFTGNIVFYLIRGVIIGAAIGFIAELLGVLSDRMRK